MNATMATETPQQAARRLSAGAFAKGFRPDGFYRYTDANGEPLFYRFRLKHPETGEKWIRPMRLDEGEFVVGEPAFPNGKPLYRLHEIAGNPDAPVIVAEGENCADALAKLGLVATTSGGASSAAAADWTPLAGREVMIWPDNDPPGQQYGSDVAERLASLGCTVSVIDAASLGLPPKGDAVDWLAAHPGATAADVRALAAEDCSGDSGDSGDSRASAAFQASPLDETQVGTVGTRTPKPGKTKGFTISGGWVLFEADGEPERVCSELVVLGRTRDAAGQSWGRLLEFKDRDGRVHRWAVPMRMLAGDGMEFRATLLDLGLLIAPGTKARQRLSMYVQEATATRTFTCTERTGWHGGAFVLPDRTLGTGDVLLQTLGEPPKLAQAGDLDQWRSAVAGPCVGNSRPVQAISAAFTPPLLDVTGDENGGMNYVGASSTGKTTMLRAAASVWGGPDFLHRWRATANGLEAVAQAHNDMPLILDELAQVDAREAGEIAYMLANGSGKHRARRDGLAKPSASWRLLFLSAGEIGLAEHMRETGKRARAGQELRLADVPADAGAGHGIFENLHGYPSGAALADALIEGARASYGTAGPAFLEKLVSVDRAELRASVETLRSDFLAAHLPAGATGQAQRLGKRFALVAAAGELATAWGITGWPAGEAIRAAGACLAACLDRRGGTGAGEDAQALAQVAHFLELHGSSRFADLAGDADRIVSNRAGYRRKDAEGRTEFLILPEVFKCEVCAGLDYRAVAKLLRERGRLVTEDKHMTIKTRNTGRVYCVREVAE